MYEPIDVYRTGAFNVAFLGFENDLGVDRFLELECIPLIDGRDGRRRAAQQLPPVPP